MGEWTEDAWEKSIGVNLKGPAFLVQEALPHLQRSEHAHVLSISPPLHLEERWFAPHAPYSITKYGMSLLVLGAAAELRDRVAVNALWPRTAIDTAAMREIGRTMEIGALRSPEIMADAAWWIQVRAAGRCGHRPDAGPVRAEPAGTAAGLTTRRRGNGPATGLIMGVCASTPMCPEEVPMEIPAQGPYRPACAGS